MEILIDCDEVLADFTKSAVKIARDKWDIDISTPHPGWDIFEHPQLKEHKAEFWSYVINNPGFVLSIEKYHYTDELLSKLREVGHLIACTSALFVGPFPGERVQWLMDMAGFERHDMIFGHQKYRIIGDVLIDDKPDNVDSWGQNMESKSIKCLPVLWSPPNGPNLKSKFGYFNTGSVDELMKEIHDFRKSK